MALEQRSRTQKPNIVCSECDHRETSLCECSWCELGRQQEMLVEVIRCWRAIEQYCRARWSYSPEHRQAHEVGFIEAVTLLALVRFGGWMSETTVEPLSGRDIPIAPAGSLSQALLCHLHQSGLIVPDFQSPIDAFEIKNGVPVDHFPLKIYWRINAVSPRDLIGDIELLARRPRLWPVSWHLTVPDVQLMLALAECREFADLCLAERGLPKVERVAGDTLFRSLLSDYSVSQCLRIIWTAAKSASDFLVRKAVSPLDATTHFTKTAQCWADRARTDGWTVKGFKRNHKLPRSQLSYILYDVFLGVGAKDFTEPLGIPVRGNDLD